jgi:hypothetical protein
MRHIRRSYDLAEVQQFVATSFICGAGIVGWLWAMIEILRGNI